MIAYLHFRFNSGLLDGGFQKNGLRITSDK